MNGAPVVKPSSARESLTGNVGGPLHIPHLFDWERAQFYITYQGSWSRSARNQVATMPTDVERQGDFSNAFVGNNPVQIFDPLTHNPFPGNIIPANRINPAATALLNYFPAAQYATLIQNYSISTSTPSTSNSVGGRLNMPVTNKDRVNVNVQYNRNASTSINLFDFSDTSAGYGLSSTVGWSHSFAPRFNNNASLAFSRNINKGTPYFAYKTNVAADLGIIGTDQTPINYGPAESFLHQLRRPVGRHGLGQSQPDHQLHRHA